MPRKSKKKNMQLKQVTTRLMQVSLILDDYIYKHGTIITEMDAEEYIKEVASYKMICKQHAQSLQDTLLGH
uniref:Uncharacterized protein n=1 Tax=Bombyx mori TaxID=7091 RepID=A0A8R2LY46_BOMMO|nr:uncharacterized protein LOC119629028 isoform X4 [Bombyx mori]